MNRRTALATFWPALLGLVLAMSAGAAAQTAFDRCDDRNASADQLIAACTSALQSSALTQQERAVAYGHRGLAYHAKGQNDRAISDYTLALKINPTNWLLYFNRANAYDDKGAADPALADYTQALRIAPTFADAYTNRGVVYAEKNQDDLAIADYTQGLTLNPKSAETFVDRGNAYLRKGQDDLAVADYTQATNVGPDDADAYYSRGNVYLKRSQADLAISDYTKALGIDSKYANAYYGRASAYQQEGKNDLAVMDYTQMLRLNPTFVGAYTGRGYSLFSLGRFSEATADFDHTRKANTAGPYAVLWLHIAHERVGDDDVAAYTANAAPLDRAKWPGPVVDLYLGKSSVAQVLAAASTSDQHCEAQFYVAEWQLWNKQADAAQSGFQQAVDTCPSALTEAVAARAELSRLPH